MSIVVKGIFTMSKRFLSLINISFLAYSNASSLFLNGMFSVINSLNISFISYLFSNMEFTTSDFAHRMAYYTLINSSFSNRILFWYKLTISSIRKLFCLIIFAIKLVVLIILFIFSLKSLLMTN